MRTIAIFNLKGGVGKTVTAINVSAILAAEHKQRVLLVDADSQCNTTEFFGVDQNAGNLADLLQADGLVTFVDDVAHKTGIDRLDVLPATDALMDLDLTKAETGRINVMALHDLVEAAAEDDQYDTVLIDCPPSFTASASAALLAADEVVIPIKLDAFSLRGMANLIRQINNMRKINPSLRVAGLLPTMWYKSDTITATERQLRDAGTLPMYQHHIRRCGIVDYMTFQGEALRTLSAHSAAGIDYRRFVAELIGG